MERLDIIVSIYDVFKYVIQRYPHVWEVKIGVQHCDNCRDNKFVYYTGINADSKGEAKLICRCYECDSELAWIEGHHYAIRNNIFHDDRFL